MQRPLFLLLALFALCYTPSQGALEVRHLKRSYKLYSGRASACPRTVSYDETDDEPLTVPASSMQADGKKCVGPGGKVLRSGSLLRNGGVPLPTLVRPGAVRFFAGVESATRVCAGHAFNATAVSYFVTSTQRIVDAPSAITLDPGNVYAIYAHFAHLCVYRSALSSEETEEIKLPAIRGLTYSDGGPVSSFGDDLPVRHVACFPATALVNTRTGTVRVSDLKIGDEVAVAPGVYSPIYTFSHRDRTAKAYFIRVTTSSGVVLELTPGHLLYTTNRRHAIPASKLSTGDSLRLADGSFSAVHSIRTIISTGLYAPHTVHGDIIVNSIIASCYTDRVIPPAAHALLAPLRALQLPAHLTDVIFDVLRPLLSFM